MEMKKNRYEAVKNYLSNLEKGAVDNILDCFDHNAMLTSPMAGRISPGDFFPNLFVQLKTAKIELIEFFNSTDSADSVAAHFKYSWELKDGSKAALQCVDIIKFAPNTDLISDLNVVAYPIQG